MRRPLPIPLPVRLRHPPPIALGRYAQHRPASALRRQGYGGTTTALAAADWCPLVTYPRVQL